MNSLRIAKIACAILLVLAGMSKAEAQLSAPGSIYTDQTQYPVFEETDPIFIFCTDKDVATGQLLATTAIEGAKTFEWQKYNELSGSFEFYFQKALRLEILLLPTLKMGVTRWPSLWVVPLKHIGAGL